MAQNGLFPVSHARHQNMYWQRFASYDFARSLKVCAITAAEILPAAASFPIIFRDTGDEVEMIAILSLKADQKTPLVSGDGRWLAFYIPSQLRCYPFKAGQGLSESDAPILLVDESSGLITQHPTDEPFFTKAGQLTPDLCAVRSFLQMREAAAAETRRLCQKITNQGLFSPIETYDDIPLPAGALTVDPDALSRLSQNQTSTLVNSGALRLIHAHHVSMSHCGWLSRIRHQKVIANQQSEGLNEFIEAIGKDITQRPFEPEAAHVTS